MPSGPNARNAPHTTILAAALTLAATVSAFADPAIIIIDGDTLNIAGERIRLVDIDAPESFRSRCENELIAGLAAKARLRELVDSGPITVTRTGRDRYRRTLARIAAGTVDIGQALVTEGHALRWQPGSEAKLARLRAWCGDNADFGDRW
jgi:endonuclease YncB( thermonuclease family)